MSTLQVNSINSFTPSDPVTINDSFKVTGSSTFTGSINIQAPHTITGTTASFDHVAVGAIGISSSGDILGATVQCKNGFEHTGNTNFNVIDGFGSEVTANGTKTQLRLTLDSSIADGAKAGPLMIKNSQISNDSAVMVSIVGPVSGGATSNSISASILSTFVESQTCSIFLYNETGQTFNDNTIFTCSLMVIK